MLISWQTKAYGWEGTLEKLNKDRNDWRKPSHARKAADQARSKILRNVHDTRLMSLRQRLIKASIAEDELYIDKLTKEMRNYLGEDQETGLYDK